MCYTIGTQQIKETHMKLRIQSIEIRSGESFGRGWKSEMYVVNGEYLASTISEHNINKWKFDFVAGETVEVVTNDSNWIARK
jgi:hypothetical protein